MAKDNLTPEENEILNNIDWTDVAEKIMQNKSAEFIGYELEYLLEMAFLYNANFRRNFTTDYEDFIDFPQPCPGGYE